LGSKTDAGKLTYHIQQSPSNCKYITVKYGYKTVYNNWDQNRCRSTPCTVQKSRAWAYAAQEDFTLMY